MPEQSTTPLLDQISQPADLRRLGDGQLRQVADELRQETINAVARTGGHLGAGLGVVELTVALHSVFDTPDDRLVWDVGHQSYPHKILTGRRDRIRTLRQGDARIEAHPPVQQLDLSSGEAFDRDALQQHEAPGRGLAVVGDAGRQPQQRLQVRRARPGGGEGEGGGRAPLRQEPERFGAGSLLQRLAEHRFGR